MSSSPARFARKQSIDVGGLARVRRFRAGYLRMAKVVGGGGLHAAKKYLDVGMQVERAHWCTVCNRQRRHARQ